MAKKMDARTQRNTTTDTVPGLVTPESLAHLIGFNIRRAQLAMRRSYFKHVGDGDVRPGQASMLRLIGANPGASQIDLANALGVDKATVVALLDRSEKAGWVIRRPGSTDRRRHELHLTKLGEKKRAALERQVQEHEAEFRARFTKQELDDLIRYLQRLYLD